MKRIVYITLFGGSLILVVIFAVQFLYFQTQNSIPNFPGVQVHQKPITLTPFSLQDHKGDPFDIERFKGHWTIAFFGYTHCPDVCPTSLTVISEVITNLKEEQPQKTLQAIFVSVDPYRDSATVLQNYVSFFSQDLIGVTGNTSNLQKLTAQIGVIYDYEDLNTGKLYRNVDQQPDTKDYVVNHYASLFLFDPQGRLVADILPPHDTVRVLNVIKIITQHFDG